MPPIAGTRLAARACGVRYQGRLDVMLMAFEEGTAIAGVLTRSLTAAAPVEWCRSALAVGRARAILVNAGNANAFTGAAGMEAVEKTAGAVAEALGCGVEEVYIASTGVIGEPLAYERITREIEALAGDLSADAWPAAAEAIMTTDTFPKGASRTAEIDGATVTLNGIAKGSGMIAPDMATTLAFVATDAGLPQIVLQALLSEAADLSFNCITVDSDTSTSDTLLLAATGKAEHPAIDDPRDERLDAFRTALRELLTDLAQQVVRDGEGAQKFATVRVTGAENDRAARRIGLAIANSPLVKTAIAGEDANWGRIVMAVGKAGERAERDSLSIRIGGVEVARDGQVAPGYDEAPVARHMKGRDISIAVDVGVGEGEATVWTCDLTHAYIDINADYRS